jgi:hypothetical protein
MSLTTEQVRRVRDAIAECDRFIAKEEPRRADLRPANVQKILDHYKAHRVKLVQMLEAA